MSRYFTAADTEYLGVGSTPITAAPFTIAAWVYPVANAWMTIFSFGDVDVADQYWSLERFQQTAYYRARAGASTVVQTTDTTAENVWVHFCAVETSNVSRAVFIDGGDKTTDVTDRSPAGADNMKIGVSPDSTPQAYMDGRVAELGFWNVALTDSEVATLAIGVSPLMIRPASLAAYWPLIRDEDQDRIGGYDMTAFNAPTVAAHMPKLLLPRPALYVPGAAAAAPAAAIMNQMQFGNLGADLYNGTLL
jgi:hypothetical protein